MENGYISILFARNNYTLMLHHRMKYCPAHIFLVVKHLMLPPVSYKFYLQWDLLTTIVINQ